MLMPIWTYASYRNIQLVPIAIPETSKKRKCNLFPRNFTFCFEKINIRIKNKLPINVLVNTIS